MAVFTTAEKAQLWELFSNDTDDLDAGSPFLQAITDFEAEDIKHPDFSLVATVQSDLAAIAALESSTDTLQKQGTLSSMNINNQVSRTWATGSSQLQGTIQNKEQLIEQIRQRIKFENYIDNSTQSRVLGVAPMRINYGKH